MASPLGTTDWPVEGPGPAATEHSWCTEHLGVNYRHHALETVLLLFHPGKVPSFSPPKKFPQHATMESTCSRAAANIVLQRGIASALSVARGRTSRSTLSGHSILATQPTAQHPFPDTS